MMQALVAETIKKANPGKTSVRPNAQPRFVRDTSPVSAISSGLPLPVRSNRAQIATMQQARGNQAVLRTAAIRPYGSIPAQCECASNPATKAGQCPQCELQHKAALEGSLAANHSVLAAMDPGAEIGRQAAPDANDLTPGQQANGQGVAEEAPAAPATDANVSSYRELTEEELRAITPVAQTTPDGNQIGPTDSTHRGCLGNQFFFSHGTDVNTTTAAQGVSHVTAHLGSAAGNCSCGCALFRQFIRGFWRAGSPTAAKQYNIGSCGSNVTMNESSFTEEHVKCITGGAPISASCDRTQADAPGFAGGLSEGTFVQMHLVLRYQIWDQCQGRSLGTADHVLNISGANSPRTITFT
jgi:hypothetical protein